MITTEAPALPWRLLSRIAHCGAGCWLWTGRIDRDGYGRLSGSLAHRIVHEEVLGAIAEGMVIDHLCRNRACVNPGHHEVVTREENARRTYMGRTHCLRGHSIPEHASTWADGRVHCNTCAGKGASS